MNNLREKFKKDFKKIKISEARKQEIFEKITTKHQHNFFTKPVIILATSFIILLGSVSFVYADEIKEVFNNLKVKLSDVRVGEDGEKMATVRPELNAIAEVNYKADIPEAEQDYTGKKNNWYSYDELESLLNIKLLKSNIFEEDKIFQFYTSKIDGNIARANFVIPKWFEYNNTELLYERIMFKMFFKTKYDEEGQPFKGWYPNSEFEEYNIENLNVDALILGRLKYGNVVRVFFVKDNIAYEIEMTFGFKNLSEETKNEYVDKRITEILQSLTY